MLWARPHRSEAHKKEPMLNASNGRRPNMSDSLPYIGVAMVEVSMNAVTTHDIWARPPRSLTMVGRAVETML